jgi:protein-tyrosine phosphatase
LSILSRNDLEHIDLPSIPKLRATTIIIEDHSSSNLAQYFTRTTDLIAAAPVELRTSDMHGIFYGPRVMVHCYRSVSRFATVVMAYLMPQRATEVGEELNLLRGKRELVKPSDGFSA